MTDYNDLKQALKNTFNGVSGLARGLAAEAGEKARALSRIAKLSLDLNAERDNTKAAYAEIGKLYYETNKENPGEFFVQLFDEVKLSGESIERMEAELAALKSGMTEDCGCADNADFESVVDEAEAEVDPADDSIEVELTDEGDKE
jgi:hypothetical protein